MSTQSHIDKVLETLQESFVITQKVYDSSYRFEPIIGHVYHLYEDKISV